MYDVPSLREELIRNESNITVLTEAVTAEIASKTELAQKIQEWEAQGEDAADFKNHLKTIQNNIDNYNAEMDKIYAYNIQVKRMIAEIEAIHGNV